MPLSPRFEQALAWAAQLHKNQFRKRTEVPYVAHLLSVTALVLEHGGDEDEAIAALLHDAIEDQGGAVVREEIRKRFGDWVTEIVDGCTDSDVTPKPPWKQRKLDFLSRIPTASASVRLVAAADKLHNARSVLSDHRRRGDAIWSRFKGGKEGTLWYYRSLVDALRAAGSNSLVEELDIVVSKLEHRAR